jgi:hypothetical protein
MSTKYPNAATSTGMPNTFDCEFMAMKVEIFFYILSAIKKKQEASIKI